MKKIFISFFSIITVATLAVTSCSKDSSTPEKGRSYKVNINASNGSNTTKAVYDDDGTGVNTFVETEEIYFCNLSDGNKIDETPINPTPGANAHNARIVGNLSGSTGSAAITYAEGNSLRLLYNTPGNGIVDYNTQDGSLASVITAATADVKITNISGSYEITTEDATFSNLQSIFKFSFRVSTGPDVYLGNKVRFVRIFSTRGMLQTQYNAATGAVVSRGPVTISRDDNLPTNYLYASLRFDQSNPSDPKDEIVFQVIDEDGKVYSGSKTAPDGGFVNGKFYTSTVDVKLYTFTVNSEKTTKVCISPGDLGKDGDVYSFTEPFTNWGQGGSLTASKRVHFDYGEVVDGRALYGIEWRLGSVENHNLSVDPHNEWRNLIKRSSPSVLNAGVKPFYVCEIAGHKWCVLLPPDETLAADIEDDLTSGNVENYLKYIAKGFVLLMNTNRYTSSWGANERWIQGGYYWVKGLADKSQLCFEKGEDPYYAKPSSAYHGLHARYVHNVE